MEQTHEIAKIAYELYLLRGGAPGDPVADWVTAEHIYAQRSARIETVVTVRGPVDVAPAVTPRVRKATVKTAPVEKAAKKETKKAATKTASVKTEKKVAAAPKAKRVSRNKATGISAE